MGSTEYRSLHISLCAGTSPYLWQVVRPRREHQKPKRSQGPVGLEIPEPLQSAPGPGALHISRTREPREMPRAPGAPVRREVRSLLRGVNPEHSLGEPKCHLLQISPKQQQSKTSGSPGSLSHKLQPSWGHGHTHTGFGVPGQNSRLLAPEGSGQTVQSGGRSLPIIVLPLGDSPLPQNRHQT